MIKGNETANGEQRETVGELSELLAAARKMGRGLAYETHGEPYKIVRDLNECLYQMRHQAREEIALIQQTLTTVR